MNSKCQRTFELIYLLLQELDKDNYFLYEQYWGVPKTIDGEKWISVKQAAEIYYKLIDKGYVKLLVSHGDNKYHPVENWREMILEPDSWREPESWGDTIYSVGSGQKYDKLFGFLSRRCKGI